LRVTNTKGIVIILNYQSTIVLNDYILPVLYGNNIRMHITPHWFLRRRRIRCDPVRYN